MSCEKCDIKVLSPGKVIEVNSKGQCINCGDGVVGYNDTPSSKWDTYFHSICIAVASKSSCLSRQIGAILVRDHSIVSTGYNGPARGIPHCGHDRIMTDKTLVKYLGRDVEIAPRQAMNTTCPRRILDYESGTHMELCPAQHAEANCISNAARLGVSVLDTTLYMNCIIPCKNCFGALINAGIVEIVVDDAKPYDIHTQFQIDNSNIKIRSFEL